MGAPFPPVPNVTIVRVQGTTPGEMWENVYYTQYSGPPPSAANLNTYTGAIFNSWQTNMASLCPSRIVLTTVTATDLGSVSGAQGITTGSFPGSRGDDVVPANAAMLVSYPVALRFRGGHFRNYLLVGGNADNQDAMSYHSAFVTEVQSHHTSFLFTLAQSGAGSTAWTQHVGVRRHGKYMPNAGPPSYVLTNPLVLPLNSSSAVYHAQMASQKGRIGRRSK